ncbi:putative membrane protein insertion efficiency factor [Geodermatophilus bullaregiensis]|uniref:membrane protein insertion efficiency factor YidD n=1 Tax=Geodermatophilus bullaregiensis TaxID=1564160 RepID=UPI00195DF648|nr:membrane protein insertion efficiency factor YidD [Geodermatophilus bullaregiensis]MBM7804595.1 putative membrane protein insertion efficiency factor [Geodermatophilus bullaregiensis]
MVFIWSSNWRPRRRRRGYGPRPGWRYGYGRRYGPPPGYGYRRHHRDDRDGGCLRDLLFLNTGCCLANAIGCSVDGLFLVPTTVRHVHAAGTGTRGSRMAERMVAAVRVYQREVSPARPPCCSFTPTCSAYAVEAIERHGARRGGRLTLRRLLRCRPGAAGGADPVPAAA